MPTRPDARAGAPIDDRDLALIAQRFAASPAFHAAGLVHRETQRRPATRAIGATAVLRFGNDHARELQVIVLPRPDAAHVFVVNIVDSGRAGTGDVDAGGGGTGGVDADARDTFALADWMRAHGVFDDTVNRFTLASYPGGFEQRLDAFIAWLGGILGMHGVERILHGDTWEDVPFDWAGMR